jgi:hypothetical protein
VSDRAVECDGRQLLVTQTCFDALRRLRRRIRIRTLWIDGICIDQSSTEEKNHQVALMRDIYSSAYSVVVWLGENRDGIDLLFHHLRHHAHLSKLYRVATKLCSLKRKRSWAWHLLSFIQRDWTEREDELSSTFIKHHRQSLLSNLRTRTQFWAVETQ